MTTSDRDYQVDIEVVEADEPEQEWKDRRG